MKIPVLINWRVLYYYNVNVTLASLVISKNIKSKLIIVKHQKLITSETPDVLKAIIGAFTYDAETLGFTCSL